MNEREAFLSAINANPKDMDLRKVFADWLDEHDEPELASFHRDLTLTDYLEAEKSLREIVFLQRDYDGELIDYDDLKSDYPEAHLIDGPELLQAGHDWLDKRDYLIEHGSESLRNSFYGNALEKFWCCFEILTGRLVPQEERNSFISCSC